MVGGKGFNHELCRADSDQRKIKQIKNQLKGAGRYRDLLLFVVGINTALRVSDLLALRVGDFFEANGTLRERFWIHEQKRGKRREVIINESMGEALELYWAAYEAGGRPARARPVF